MSPAPAAGDERRVVLRHAPSLAGGPLRILNGALSALAEARRRGQGWTAELVLDERLLQSDDRKLLLLNAQGNPVKLAGPENGRFDAAGRAALAGAAVDAMPPTADAEELVDRLLPAAGDEPLEAEVRLWRGLLGRAGLVVSAVTAGSPGAAEESWEAPEATWFGPRHLQALEQFGALPRTALEGEKALKRALTPPPPVRLAEQLELLQAETAGRLAALEDAIRAEEPRLFGAWCRLRRESGRGVAGFVQRVERSLRNRDGIRGSRLRMLAQGLRPYDAPQQDGLGLMAAAVLFGLDLDQLDRAIPAWEASGNQAPLLVEAGSGAWIP
ncbi:MAG: hypothetical protein ISR76_05340 [Planctomycetes bacterium]|nr:hypothetical protein [Planctomycetota bacterium]